MRLFFFLGEEITLTKRFEQAFLDGYKPATITFRQSRFFDQFYPELKRYPNIEISNEVAEGFMFFQTEEMKAEYINKMKNVEEDSFFDHYYTGLALGFPERSVRLFSNFREIEALIGEMPKEEERLGVGINWAGFQFKSFLPFVQEEIGWLWSVYKHPKSVNVPLYLRANNQPSIEIPYGDYQLLDKLIKEIREEQEATVASA